MDFTRKASIQTQDTFPANSSPTTVDAFIREQKVPGELVISYPGNGGRSSIVFRGKAAIRRAEIAEAPEPAINESEAK